jgi:hypothetical protein
MQAVFLFFSEAKHLGKFLQALEGATGQSTAGFILQPRINAVRRKAAAAILLFFL